MSDTDAVTLEGLELELMILRGDWSQEINGCKLVAITDCELELVCWVPEDRAELVKAALLTHHAKLWAEKRADADPNP